MDSAKEQSTLLKLFQSSMALNAIGTGVLIYSLWHRQSVLGGTLDKASFCNVNDYVNCEAIALSSWAEGFLGIPTAAWGVIFHLVLLAWSLLGYFRIKDNNKEEAADFAKSSALLSFVGLVPSLFLAFISLGVLKLLCLICVATYVIVAMQAFLGVFLMGAAKRLSPLSTSLFSLPKGALSMSVVAVAIGLLSPLVIKGMVGGMKVDDQTLNAALAQHYSNPAISFNVSPDAVPSKGPADAPITIVEFSDFQCPYCARASLVIPEMVNAYSGKVRFVFKHYPLDPSCNVNMQAGGGHTLACYAAKLGACVFRKNGSDGFFKYEETAFANQSSLTRASLESYAQEQGGLSAEEVKACADDPQIHERVSADIAEAQAAGVSGTPSVFINGRKLEYGSFAPVLKPALDSYIKSLNAQ